MWGEVVAIDWVLQRVIRCFLRFIPDPSLIILVALIGPPTTHGNSRLQVPHDCPLVERVQY
jgi:hypothetical protein